MRGRKKSVWAVAICAIFITAGLILSCGDDDDDGEVTATCRTVCEKMMNECGFELEDTVDECVAVCEADEGMDQEFLDCLMDTDCEDIEDDCETETEG